MPKYLILSRFHDKNDLSDIQSRSQKVKDAIIAQVPSLFEKWSCKLATMSDHFQVLDVVDAPNHADVMKAAALIEKHGHCRTEVLPVVDWPEFVSTQSSK
jgi:uncharacterized protein with GYD domain